MKKKILLPLSLLFVTCTLTAQTELLSNGSFESGDLTDWDLSAVNGVDQGAASCTENWRVQADSFDICVLVPDVAPTDGASAAFTSFDTDVPDTEWILEQTVTLPANVLVMASVSFDFAAEFDFGLGNPINFPRELNLDLYTTGGVLIGNIFNDGFLDAGAISVAYSENADVLALLTGLEGTDVVLRITALIPEIQTGPSKAMIDNLSFLVEETLGVTNNNLNSQLNVFPNPSSGKFNLNYSGTEQITSVKIYDITGKLIYSENLLDIKNTMEFNISLSSGMFLLEVKTETQQTTKKLVIK